MFYKTLEVIDEEYQGESYYRTLGKSNGAIWTSTETTYLELLRRSGGIAYTAALDKSNDNKQMIMKIPGSVTSNIIGPYLILVYLLDAADPNIKDVVAKYEIEYSKREAV